MPDPTPSPIAALPAGRETPMPMPWTVKDTPLKNLFEVYEGDSRVAMCNRLTDAQQIAAEHNSHADLRDAIRLIIGRETNRPWMDVPMEHVDGYLASIRRLKS